MNVMELAEQFKSQSEIVKSELEATVKYEKYITEKQYKFFLALGNKAGWSKITERSGYQSGVVKNYIEGDYEYHISCFTYQMKWTNGYKTTRIDNKKYYFTMEVTNIPEFTRLNEVA